MELINFKEKIKLTFESDSAEACASSLELCSIKKRLSIIQSGWLAILHKGQRISGIDPSISENFAVKQFPQQTCKHSKSFGESEAVNISEHHIHFDGNASIVLFVSST